VNELSWSHTGSLAFGWAGWAGSIPGSTAGVYVLNTNRAGGSLLSDSLKVFCPVHPQQTNPLTYIGTNTAFLTPDGTTIISPVPQPIPVGQRPPACANTRGLRATMPELEEFSASTGQATSVLYASHWHGAEESEVYWSNPSGSVLVVQAAARPEVNGVYGLYPSTGGFGILIGSTFTPIKGASSPPVAQIAF
jgi:hypothetical protein